MKKSKIKYLVMFWAKIIALYFYKYYYYNFIIIFILKTQVLPNIDIFSNILQGVFMLQMK